MITEDEARAALDQAVELEKQSTEAARLCASRLNYGDVAGAKEKAAEFERLFVASHRAAKPWLDYHRERPPATSPHTGVTAEATSSSSTPTNPNASDGAPVSATSPAAAYQRVECGLITGHGSPCIRPAGHGGGHSSYQK